MRTLTRGSTARAQGMTRRSAHRHPLIGRAKWQTLLDPHPSWSTDDTQQALAWAANDTHYLSRTDTAFDSRNSSNKFSLEFWFRHGEYKAGVRGYFCLSNGTGIANNQWIVSNYISSGYETHAVTFGCNNGAGGWAYVMADFTYESVGSRQGDCNGFYPWSQCLIVYDGSLAAADRAQIYLNGKRSTVATSGTIPATMTSIASLVFEIGRNRAYGWGGTTLSPNIAYPSGHTAATYTNMCSMGPVRYWNTAIANTTAGSATSVTTSLYNSGRPKRYRDTDSTERTGLLAAWDWETSPLTDQSGNGKTLTENGTARYITVVLSAKDLVDGARWMPRWGYMLPAPGSTYALAGATGQTALLGLATADGLCYARSPRLVQNFNSQYAYECDQGGFLVRTLPGSFLYTTTNDMWHSWAADYVPSWNTAAETFGYAAGLSTAGSNTYYLGEFNSPSAGLYRWSTRSRNGASWNQQSTASTTAAIDGSLHVTKVTDPNSSNPTVEDNGAAKTMVGAPTAVSSWWGDIAPGATRPDRLAIHSLPQGGIYSGGNRARYGICASAAPGMTAVEIAQVEQYLAGLYGITFT